MEVIRQHVKLTKKVAHLENRIKEEVENHACEKQKFKAQTAKMENYEMMLYGKPSGQKDDRKQTPKAQKE